MKNLLLSLFLSITSITLSQVNTCVGNYYDSGGAGGTYTNNENVTTTYCSNAGNCIEITFNSFNIESGWDFLSVYDGSTVGSPLIGTYTGTALNGQTITSTSGCLTINFTSDGSITAPGWAFSVNCVPCPVPTCTDGIQNQGETGIDCGGPCPICPPIVQPTACGNLTYNIVIPGSSVAFYDDGGPGGLPCTDGPVAGGNYCNCNCFTTTTICAAPGEYIYVDFHEFAMWNTTSGWDWMKIYDGPTTAGTVLYDNSSTGPDNPFGDCGINGQPMEFCSTNQCLTFEFWATSVVNRAGWDATVYSTSTQCILPLPVELSEFYGYNDGRPNKLLWTTITETNNDYFILERSSDGYEWLEIGKVDGNGTSQNEINYTYLDKTYDNIVNYYRLTQIDFNGDFETHNVITIDNTQNKKEIVNKTNLMGQEIDDTYRGMVIIYYGDGTITKTLQNFN